MLPRPEPVLNESLFIVTPTTMNFSMNALLATRSFILHAPRPHKDGQLSFPLSLDEAWLAYIASKEIKPRALYSDEQYDLRPRFLTAPNAALEASDTATPKQMSNAKHRCVNDYEIKGTRIFRKPMEDMPARYLARLREAFQIMTNVHAQLMTAVHARLRRRLSSFTRASLRSMLLGWLITVGLVS